MRVAKRWTTSSDPTFYPNRPQHRPTQADSGDRWSTEISCPGAASGDTKQLRLAAGRVEEEPDGLGGATEEEQD